MDYLSVLIQIAVREVEDYDTSHQVILNQV